MYFVSTQTEASAFSCYTAMAIGAAYFTFRYLLSELTKRAPFTLANTEFLSATNVVEFENVYVALSTIHARVSSEVRDDVVHVSLRSIFSRLCCNSFTQLLVLESPLLNRRKPGFSVTEIARSLLSQVVGSIGRVIHQSVAVSFVGSHVRGTPIFGQFYIGVPATVNT